MGWSGVTASSYYYKPSVGRKGAKPSTHTANTDGEIFENTVVVKSVEDVLRSEEFCCYGYRVMTDELHDQGWIINHKKVYRLMSENHLLFNSRIRVIAPQRNFIRFRKIEAERPLQYLSMDIKYIHIHGQGKNALLLTVIDVFSRKVLTHMLRFNIKKGDVMIMLSLLLLEYSPEGMTLRNDNGSQFIAGVVRQFLKEKGVYQEFSHVATPEDNAYIEAYHSIVQREVVDRFEFESVHHARLLFDRYYRWYNERRKHGSLNRKTPQQIWNSYFYYQNPNPIKTEKNPPNLLNHFNQTVQ